MKQKLELSWIDKESRSALEPHMFLQATLSFAPDPAAPRQVFPCPVGRGEQKNSGQQALLGEGNT
jgi:hypothetical protein